MTISDPTHQTTPTRDEAVRSFWETQRDISHQEADEAAIRLINSHFKNDAERARVSIPANPDRDDDLIIRSYIRQQMRLTKSAPAPTSGGVDAVAVKPLEWSIGVEPNMWFGDGLFGARWQIVNHVHFGPANFGARFDDEDSGALAWCSTLDEAKAAAQADYEQRIRSALSPAATPVSEAGGEPKGWAAVYDGQIKSCHRSRETCVADAEHYQAIHPVYLGPAWRHQED